MGSIAPDDRYASCQAAPSLDVRTTNSARPAFVRKFSTALSIVVGAPRSTVSQTLRSLRSALSGCQNVSPLPSTALSARPHEQAELLATVLPSARFGPCARASPAIDRMTN